MEREVVRWCTRCGAVTIDVDADTRTAPGAIMEMRLPQTERLKQFKEVTREAE